jgi:glycosyltransferase involved in cell wall biosynthesis
MATIIWLTENYFPRTGGMAQSCDRIVYHLRQANTEIHVMHITNFGKIRRENVQNGTNLHFPLAENSETPIDEAHSLNLLWNEIAKIANNTTSKITHLVCFGGYLTMTAAPIFATWLSVPLVVLLRGNDFDTGIFSPRKREVLDFALQKASCVACVTQEKTEKVQKLYPKTKVVFTPNGIDATEWKLLPSDLKKVQEIRTSFGEKPRIIGIFGQLKAKKGVLFFMQCLENCSFAQQIHLLIVGEMDKETQNFIENTTHSFTFTHIPFMSRFDLLPYYAVCDVVAIPSFYDGMPNVLLEAAAVGVPFIASDSGGMTDVLQIEHAWIFKTNNSESCLQALEEFWERETEILKAKGKILQQHIKQNFTYQKERDKYLEIFA